ncbi:MAG: SDR family NAD(P)-dependent oxidoreductase [Desulforhopalus sp.]|jgi:3-oxoacyl-[acyl-carrier protein] reductase|nr:SDR family NAD(P)-dependent oxidoreductase [Desulforhopalus sp.]
MLKIEGAGAVITGGSGGIGMALARRWLELGGRAVIADINGEALEKAKAELGGGVETFVGNVTREEDCSALAAFAMEKMGRINLVAPFAGIIRDGLLLSPDRETGKVTGKMSLQDWQMVVDINLTGVFLTVRECAEQMINHRCRGLICLVSSTGSLGTAGQINYASTKAAMSVMPKVITAEFFRRKIADRIRCVAIAPGYVGTDMVRNMNQKALDKILAEVPIGRLIEPEEVATLACDIYKNEALAGETYFIHGGLRLGSRG